MTSSQEQMAAASMQVRQLTPRYSGQACQRCGKAVTLVGTAAEPWQYGSLSVGGPLHVGCAMLQQHPSDTNPLHVLKWAEEHPV